MTDQIYAYLKQLKNGVIPAGRPWRDSLAIPLTFLYAALSTLLIIKFGFQNSFYHYFAHLEPFQDFAKEEMRLSAQAYLSISSALLFLFFPLLLHGLFPVDVPLGMGFAGSFKELPIALLMISVMIPVLWFSFADPAFYDFYPMYKPSSLKLWLLYEAIYLSHFFTVEFFFRGFLLFRLEKFYPGLGIWITLVPYCLIHLHKPLPEALASLFAGYLLGTLALMGRSIWPGVLVHTGVAFFADFFALIHSGRWGNML